MKLERATTYEDDSIREHELLIQNFVQAAQGAYSQPSGAEGAGFLGFKACGIVLSCPLSRFLIKSSVLVCGLSTEEGNAVHLSRALSMEGKF